MTVEERDVLSYVLPPDVADEIFKHKIIWEIDSSDNLSVILKKVRQLKAEPLVWVVAFERLKSLIRLGRISLDLNQADRDVLLKEIATEIVSSIEAHIDDPRVVQSALELLNDIENLCCWYEDRIPFHPNRTTNRGEFLERLVDLGMVEAVFGVLRRHLRKIPPQQGIAFCQPALKILSKMAGCTQCDEECRQRMGGVVDRRTLYDTACLKACLPDYFWSFDRDFCLKACQPDYFWSFERDFDGEDDDNNAFFIEE